MKILITLVVAALFACLSGPAEARCRLFGRRARAARAHQQVAFVSQRTTTVQTTTTAVYAAPQATTNDAASFLQSLNGWRAARGRGPLAWDGNLAAYASRNNGVHAPGSSGGAAQCYAPTSSLTSAFSQWIASPAHASILLNATTSIGASPCPSGATCNAR